MSKPSVTPLRVLVTRGDHVESHHDVTVALARGGRLERSLGDVERPVFARSAAKPIQALPLILSGAADAFDLTDAELAVACASHSGTTEHVVTVAGMLAKGGLEPDQLRCGIHPPFHKDSERETLRSGREFEALQNNCSGKHAGMLLLAKHTGAPLETYLEPDHPVQLSIRDLVARISGCDPSEIHEAVDGCGVPVHAFPLWRLAVAYERLAWPEAVEADLEGAVRRITSAIAANPRIYGGPDRLASRVTETAGQQVFIKEGAEGVFAAGRKGPSGGLALKADDGSSRASWSAVAHVLEAAGWIDETAAREIRQVAAPPIRNCHGDVVGGITIEGSPLQERGTIR